MAEEVLLEFHSKEEEVSAILTVLESEGEPVL